MFGSGSIDQAMFETILSILPEGKTILELGSGYGTSRLVEHYKVHSVEHNEKWLGKYHSNYIYAPLKTHKEVYKFTGNTWYDPKVIYSAIPGLEYDLLLIDGPPYERAGFLKYIGAFNLDVPIFFDDVHRPHELGIINSVSLRLRTPFIVFYHSYKPRKFAKRFGVINYPGIPKVS